MSIELSNLIKCYNLDTIKLEEDKTLKIVLDSDSVSELHKICDNPLFSTATNLVIMNDLFSNIDDIYGLSDLKKHFTARKNESKVIIISNSPDKKSVIISDHDTDSEWKLSYEKNTTMSGFQQKTYGLFGSYNHGKEYPCESEYKIDCTRDNRIIEAQEESTGAHRYWDKEINDVKEEILTTRSEIKSSVELAENYNPELLIGCMKNIFDQVGETFTDLS